MSFKEYVRAIVSVAKLSFKTAPGPLTFKMFGIIIGAFLPIAVTYFAARTTTELAAAFSGNPTAGRQAILLIIITAVLGLIATLWRSLDQYMQAIVRYKIQAKVSDMMYEQFLSLDFWQYDDKDTADLYDRAQKFSQFYAYVFDRLGAIVTQFITSVFAIIALSVFLPWIALLVGIAIVPGMYIQFKISRAQVAHWNKNVESRRARSFIEWNLLQPTSIAELRLNGLVRYLLSLRRSLRDKDEKGRLLYERKFIAKRLLADCLEAATELGALLWIAAEIIHRNQPIGQFVYVQQMINRAMSGASGFIDQLSTIDEDLANLFDYQEFMSLPTGKKDGTILKHEPEMITFNDVSFRYPQTDTDVLKRISFSIAKGQHIAIVGENGAGKSTLIKLLTGLYAPTKGDIVLDDTSLAEINTPSWHQKLSVLHQEFQKYVFTDIQNNVYFGNVEKPVKPASLRTALDAAEATDFIEKLPRGLGTYPSTWMEDDEGNKGVNLSGGQWQRLALARNFYRNAPIIILDEPTSAIDALAEERIFKRLFAKANKHTVITISHRLSTVEKADVIIVLDDGQIVEQGTHKELVTKRGMYYAMFKSQLTK